MAERTAQLPPALQSEVIMADKRSDEDIAKLLSRVTYKKWNFLMEVRGKPDEGDTVR